MLDNICVIVLDRKKLGLELKARGISLSRFAAECGISRQSLYDMFNGGSIFSVPFSKVLSYTGLAFEDLVSKGSKFESIISGAPEGIRKATLYLQKFSEKHNASLFLIGSRARGKRGPRADWDFAIYFSDKRRRRSLALIKQRMEDIAFPHRIDLVDLNSAPRWFLRSIEHEAISLCGASKVKDILARPSDNELREAI